MKSYLICAAGAIFISIIASLLIPDGKLNKTITFVMRLVCIFVLIQPVTQIFDISAESTDKDLADYEYVSIVYSSHQGRQLEYLLEENYGGNFFCNVEVDYIDGQFEVKNVEVYTEKNNPSEIQEIYEYLGGLGYINITVYATGI